MSEKKTIEKEVYKKWLEDEVNLVADMTLEQIQDRIMELELKQFEIRTKLSRAHERRQSLLGKQWSEYSQSISSPDFKVNLEADPRKRTKKEAKPKLSKKDKLQQAMSDAGIDMTKLLEAIQKKKAARAAEAKEKENG